MKFWLTLISLLYCLSASAELKPFHAEYLAKFKGVPLASGTRTLTKVHQQQYQMRSQAKILAGSVSFSDLSRFEIDGNQVKTLGFQYKESGLFGGTQASGYPDRKGGLIVTVDGKRHSFPATEDLAQLMDPAAFSIKMQIDLKSGSQELVYNYVALDELKDQDFRVIAQESLTTELGTFDTLKLEHINSKNRRTWLWVAPELDYHLVKSEIIRKGKSWATLETTKLTFHSKNNSLSAHSN